MKRKLGKHDVEKMNEEVKRNGAVKQIMGLERAGNERRERNRMGRWAVEVGEEIGRDKKTSKIYQVRCS